MQGDHLLLKEKEKNRRERKELGISKGARSEVCPYCNGISGEATRGEGSEK